MNEDNEYPEAVEPEPDPRILAMHRVVNLERDCEHAVREAERRQKMAALAQEELRQARDELSGLLGYPSNSNRVKTMDSETAAYISRVR